MKKIATSLTLALFMSLTSQVVWADEIKCSGINLLDQLNKNDPEKVARLAKDAATLLNGKGLFWKVTKPGVKPSYLFGTMHMSDERLLDLSPKAEKAFNEANTLALEITDILDPAAMAQKSMGLMKHMMYLDGSSLVDKAPKNALAPVKARIEARGEMPWSLAQKLKPWAILGSLALPACEQARKKAGKPFLDMSLGLRAKEAGKELVALETLEGQMLAIAALSEPMMIDALIQTAQMFDQLDNVFETMIQLYEAEDIATIWAMMRHIGPEGLTFDNPRDQYAEFQRGIVDARNVTMADGSEPLLKKGGAFIAVGALHLPGENGLVNILAKRGYTITRP